MIFQYNKYIFNIRFNRKIIFDTLPSFIFRNNIGFQLRKIVCVFKNNDCSTCLLGTTCVYSLMFETPIDKNNNFLEGRNRAPHPYAVYSDAKAGKEIDSLDLDIVMIGNAINYFPYLFLALMNTGKSGILRDRINFEIDDIVSQNRSILDKENDTVKNMAPLTWDLNGVDDIRSEAIVDLKNVGGIRIDFLSPFRMKFGGKYLTAITYKDIICAILRRIELLSKLFGNTVIDFGKDLIYFLTKDKKFTSDLKWFDYSRYSARQKQSMKLGGLIGTATVTGNFSNIEVSLLRAAELFNIGKNVSFGLGKVRIRKLLKGCDECLSV